MGNARSEKDRKAIDALRAEMIVHGTQASEHVEHVRFIARHIEAAVLPSFPEMEKDQLIRAFRLLRNQTGELHRLETNHARMGRDWPS